MVEHDSTHCISPHSDHVEPSRAVDSGDKSIPIRRGRVLPQWALEDSTPLVKKKGRGGKQANVNEGVVGDSGSGRKVPGSKASTSGKKKVLRPPRRKTRSKRKLELGVEDGDEDDAGEVEDDGFFESEGGEANDELKEDRAGGADVGDEDERTETREEGTKPAQERSTSDVNGMANAAEHETGRRNRKRRGGVSEKEEDIGSDEVEVQAPRRRRARAKGAYKDDLPDAITDGPEEDVMHAEVSTKGRNPRRPATSRANGEQDSQIDGAAVEKPRRGSKARTTAGKNVRGKDASAGRRKGSRGIREKGSDDDYGDEDVKDMEMELDLTVDDLTAMADQHAQAGSAGGEGGRENGGGGGGGGEPGDDRSAGAGEEEEEEPAGSTEQQQQQQRRPRGSSLFSAKHWSHVADQVVDGGKADTSYLGLGSSAAAQAQADAHGRSECGGARATEDRHRAHPDSRADSYTGKEVLQAGSFAGEDGQVEGGREARGGGSGRPGHQLEDGSNKAAAAPAPAPAAAAAATEAVPDGFNPSLDDMLSIFLGRRPNTLPFSQGAAASQAPSVTGPSQSHARKAPCGGGSGSAAASWEEEEEEEEAVPGAGSAHRAGLATPEDSCQTQPAVAVAPPPPPPPPCPSSPPREALGAGSLVAPKEKKKMNIAEMLKMLS